MPRFNVVRNIVTRFFKNTDQVLTDDSDSGIVRRRMHAKYEGDFVVFHIGMRINTWWKIHRWLPIIILAPQLVRELHTDNDSGLLESRTTIGPGLRNIGFVQYWRSFNDLQEYARDNDYLHLDAWEGYNQGEVKSRGAVGIWHETFLVRDGEYETIYTNMPPHALGAAVSTRLVPATGQHESASGRFGFTAGDDAPLDLGENTVEKF